MKISLSNPASSGLPVQAGAPRRFTKEVIRAGRFFVPHMGIWLDVTRDRMDRWVSNFVRMRDAGVNAPLTTDHGQSADDVRGDVKRLFREGDKLIMECQVPDDESEALLERCPHVSLELEKDFKDGTGHKYDESITAVTITSKPVVPGQEPFKRIAASRNVGGEETIMFAFQNTHDIESADCIREMEEMAFGPARVNLSTGGGLPSNKRPEGAAGMVRNFLMKVLSEAEDRFGAAGGDDPSAVDDFIDRVREGDLRKLLTDAIMEKLPSPATDADVEKVVIQELKKLWQEQPPGPADHAEDIFGDAATKLSRTIPPAGSDQALIDEMTDMAFGPHQ